MRSLTNPEAQEKRQTSISASYVVLLSGQQVSYHTRFDNKELEFASLSSIAVPGGLRVLARRRSSGSRHSSRRNGTGVRKARRRQPSTAGSSPDVRDSGYRLSRTPVRIPGRRGLVSTA